MTLQTSFDVLSRVVEQYESRGRTVGRVEATADKAGDGLDATLEVPVSLCAAEDDSERSMLTPETAEMTAGGVQVAFSTSPLAALPQSTAAAVSASEESVHVVDGDIILTVHLRIDPQKADDAMPDSDDRETVDEGTTPPPMDESDPEEPETENPEADEDSDPTNDLAAVRDESVPPYEDTAYLRRLYETCDTFTQMSETIAMEVSSETVRRYMITADIHDPESYDLVEETGTGDDSELIAGSDTETEADGRDDSAGATESERSDDPEDPSEGVEESTEASGSADAPVRPETTDDPLDELPDEQLVTDGSGLPGDTEVTDVAEAVVESMTVYEVQEYLGLERRETQEMLKRLNLIDFTMRRLSEQPEREVSYDQVVTRICQCAPAET
jgi:hypothetical protein